MACIMNMNSVISESCYADLKETAFMNAPFGMIVKEGAVGETEGYYGW